ncbi:MAG: hypothetical protein AB8G16_11555 [Gammaproteobacteria bacterium]
MKKLVVLQLTVFIGLFALSTFADHGAVPHSSDTTQISESRS